MSPRTVLVVDDERAICVALQRLLEREGYQVFAAESGEAGLELLKTQPVQLVISDKDMPGMGGLKFLDLVHDRHPRVCRLLLTGRADLPSVLRAINEGEVFRILEKPCTNEHLLNTLHFAFETLELEATNRRQARELELERQRSEELLLNVMPRSVADRLKNGEKVIADRYLATTVLFSDLADFTQLGSSLPPAELVSVLNELFSSFDELAGVHGVEKIKTLGDGYLAVAGLPGTRRDHAVAIADFALGMLGAVATINQVRTHRLALRIGIHTGPVVAGVIGLKKFTYDLWGDTVNVASRMEATGVAGHVQVSEAVYRVLRDTHTFEARGAIDVKGKGELPTWLLLGRRIA